MDKLRALRWAVSEVMLQNLTPLTKVTQTETLLNNLCCVQVQHHDGITGTESPKVADMYLQHLRQAMMEVEELLAALFLLPHGLGVAGISHSLNGKTGQ